MGRGASGKPLTISLLALTLFKSELLTHALLVVLVLVGSDIDDDRSFGLSQAYAHKILTGRRSRMHTIRQTCGLAGFPKRDESIYDAFGAGHSSTSISAGLGKVRILRSFFLSMYYKVTESTIGFLTIKSWYGPSIGLTSLINFSSFC